VGNGLASRAGRTVASCHLFNPDFYVAQVETHSIGRARDVCAFWKLLRGLVQSVSKVARTEGDERSEFTNANEAGRGFHFRFPHRATLDSGLGKCVL
jgi:hypothetical protein